MSWNSLSETLVELASAIVPPEGTGLLVTDAEISIPLEVRIATTGAGLTVLAQPAQSRWKSGFLQPTHMARISIELEEGDGR